MNNRIIINADDCGKSKEVDNAIEECILNKKLTSTTIMANMDDFDGAVKLYANYQNTISFGCHLVLTEGHPMTQSMLLLNEGYFVERDGLFFFNRDKFMQNKLSKPVQKEVFKELSAQVNKLLDYGIAISHLDSHHHIHTKTSILPVVAEISKVFNINKIRRIRNYLPMSLDYLKRKVWRMYLAYLNSDIHTTQFFDSFNSFYEYAVKKHFVKNNKTIELMIHPGHPKELYKKEIDILMNTDLNTQLGGYLINYNQL